MRERRAAGREYLDLVTDLLQAARLASPHGGVWEAADFQWWWRRDQHPDPAAATFWLDDDERPVAAVTFMNWADNLGCDLLHARHDSEAALALVGRRLETLLDEHPADAIEMTIRADDAPLLEAAAALGFVATDDLELTTTMPASERPPLMELPDGFVVASYAERTDRPHHMVGRSGERVAAFLQDCSLYRADLDLCIVEQATDVVAAYGLFWADPVTGVGLVEPMRTEDAYQGRGLAKAVLRAGLARLAESGCSELKITHQDANEPAKRAYLGAGFRDPVESRPYRREPR